VYYELLIFIYFDFILLTYIFCDGLVIVFIYDIFFEIDSVHYYIYF